MLAGNLASIGVGAIVATVSSLIVSVFLLIDRRLLNHRWSLSGPITSSGRRPAPSTSQLPRPLEALTRKLTVTAKRRNAMSKSNLDPLPAIHSIQLKKKMNSTPSLSTKPSNSQRIHPLAWCAPILTFECDSSNSFVLVHRTYPCYSFTSILFITHLWCRRSDWLGNCWYYLDLLLCHFSRPLPSLREPGGSFPHI